VDSSDVGEDTSTEESVGSNSPLSAEEEREGGCTQKWFPPQR